MSEYHGSERPIDLVYHCNQHGDTYTTINAKNVCKSFFLPLKELNRNVLSTKCGLLAETRIRI